MEVDRLIKNRQGICIEKPVMFCFPFAGGGASAFNGWIQKISSQVTVCPIQLPGREDRIMENPYLHMGTLVDDLVAAILPYIGFKVFLFGHSMGAKIAYEVERKIEKLNCRAELLMVSGTAAPHVPTLDPVFQLPDKQFKRALARFAGTPKEILQNEPLLDFFLPMLKADFTLDETYYAKTIVPVKCPLMAIGGTADQEAGSKEIKEWKQYAAADFYHQMFGGGHFFIRENEEQVLNYLMNTIIKVAEQSQIQAV